MAVKGSERKVRETRSSIGKEEGRKG